MTSVQEYAAREARYICEKRNPGVGYSQSNRWSWYDRCDDQGWLTRPLRGTAPVSSPARTTSPSMFCSARRTCRDGSQGMFPVSGATWTGRSRGSR